MKRFLLCGLLVLFGSLVAGPAQAQWGFDFDDQGNWKVMISAARLDHELDGDLLWGEGVGNTTLDVQSTLDFEDAEDFAGWITAQPGGGSLLRLGYLPFEFGGDSVLSAAETVNGITYGVGDRVSSGFEFDSYELAYGYRFQLGPYLMVAPMIELNVFDGALGTVDLDLAGSAVTEDFVVPIALTGLRVEVSPLPRLTFFAEGKGFKAGDWGELKDATVTDGELGAYIYLHRNLVLTAAYRVSDVRFDVSQTEIDLDLSGLSFSLDFRF